MAEGGAVEGDHVGGRAMAKGKAQGEPKEVPF